jgi:hypothetical protein
MKLITTPLNPVYAKLVTPEEAVAYFVQRAENRSEGELADRLRMRAEAVEGVLGRLLGAIIENGVLHASQVEAIFDYDVTAEN